MEPKYKIGSIIEVYSELINRYYFVVNSSDLSSIYTLVPLWATHTEEIYHISPVENSTYLLTEMFVEDEV